MVDCTLNVAIKKKIIKAIIIQCKIQIIIDKDKITIGLNGTTKNHNWTKCYRKKEMRKKQSKRT